MPSRTHKVFRLYIKEGIYMAQNLNELLDDQGKVVGYLFESRTSGVFVGRVYPDSESAWKDRKAGHQPWFECKCGQQPLSVTAHSDGEKNRKVVVCLKCEALVDDPDGEDYSHLCFP